MAKKLQGWDQRVREAQREPIEFDLADGTTITVKKITGGQWRKIKRIQRGVEPDVEDEDEAAVEVLFGKEKAAKILADYEDAPLGVLGDLTGEIIEHFADKKKKSSDDDEDDDEGKDQPEN
ncbi:hypothetical protein KXR83_05795 [Williamsia muralis]|uniref:hypothetical protein n=1 Tax=Williamsia marianensis TaxID=85044 RepID=UPI003F16DE5C